MIAFADTLLRGAALGALSLLAIRFALLRPVRPATTVAVALAVCMIAYAVASAPFAPRFPPVAETILSAAPTANPFLLWLLGLFIFDDDFRIRPWHAIPAVVTVAAAFFEPLHPLRAAAVTALYAHLLWAAWITARGDLVAGRILFRRVFFAVAALTGLAVTYVEVTFAAPPPALSLLQAAALAAMSGGFLYWSHAVAPDLLPRRAASPPPQHAGPAADDPLYARLSAAMADEIWRTEGLTIGALSERLGAPEHQVRRLINRRMGHRNFAGFINAARVEAAARALADPDQADKQILTIAYESGFASLGPFNRAFRAAKGVSPGEWRDTARRN